MSTPITSRMAQPRSASPTPVSLRVALCGIYLIGKCLAASRILAWGVPVCGRCRGIKGGVSGSRVSIGKGKLSPGFDLCGNVKCCLIAGETYSCRPASTTCGGTCGRRSFFNGNISIDLSLFIAYSSSQHVPNPCIYYTMSYPELIEQVEKVRGAGDRRAYNFQNSG